MPSSSVPGVTSDATAVTTSFEEQIKQLRDDIALASMYIFIIYKGINYDKKCISSIRGIFFFFFYHKSAIVRKIIKFKKILAEIVRI